MKIPLLKLNAVAFAIAITYPLSVFAGTVSGAGSTQTVAAGAPAEDWTVDTSGSLVISDDGTAGHIEVNDGTLTAGNTGVSITSILANENATVNLTGVQVSNSSAPAVQLANVDGGPGASLTATNSDITGLGAGLTLISGSSVATLDNTRVTATGVSSSVFQPATGGNSIGDYGGVLNILNGSVVSGTENGIAVEVDDRYSTSAEISVNNSAVSGQNGSAIWVGMDPYSAAMPVNIAVSNGATLTGGNGDILTVADGAIANLSVSDAALTGNITNDIQSTANVTLSDNASLTGTLSNVTSLSLGNASTVTLTGNSTVTTLSNGGTLAFSDGAVGRTLTVNGDYTGNNGLIIFNSVLSGDSSLTDRLLVNGDTAGTTRVSINNLGGAGDATVNGFEVIGVTGNSAGEFTEAGPVVAGAYDYHLVRGVGTNAGNWYLTSELTAPDGGDNGTPPDNSGDGGNETPDSGTKIFRPEGGAYAANLLAANTLFTTSLADRQGETAYTDALTGEKKLTSLWMKNTGTHTRNDDGSGQLKTQSNSYVLMLGGDMAAGEAQGGSSWRLGALGGYANSRSNTTSSLAGRDAKGEMEGYTAGLYGTWYAQGNDREGLYLDSVVQYSWFDNTVNGEGLSSEKYNSDGMQASLEAGYVIPLGGSGRSTWYIQPNAQAGWSGIQADRHTESNGTVVSGNGDDNVRTRLGVKVFSEGHSQVDDGKGRSFRPFAEVNWIHNTEQYGVNMDGVNVTSEGTRNIGEAKIGVQGSVTPSLNVTGTVGQQMGDAGYSSTAAAVGLKYTF
ncbi:autotransporter outer membrane beta-barrel domain-containing protein [Rahnella laticis]|uniref:autotransporter outer membrane beta-barrel domain-containing protein n=1 Tax=Rahnella laticis TaxID=2787622 RepID=UPI0018A30BAE|nr:autotransporter outer membrane beta-barrel domain-containing protein [Rahnella laticis]MBF7997506.1 autotransporter outer membrane beta-barrel domain-containing protein [Rahnella laticis]